MTQLLPKNEDDKYPKIYTFLIGHAFGGSLDKSPNDYVVEPIGRFGTPTEAEAHVDIINMDIKKSNGVLVNSKEFPFLVIESLTVEFKEDDNREGKSESFFIYDHGKNRYENIGNISRLDCLDEYKERVEKFIELQKQEERNYNDI